MKLNAEVQLKTRFLTNEQQNNRSQKSELFISMTTSAFLNRLFGCS